MLKRIILLNSLFFISAPVLASSFNKTITLGYGMTKTSYEQSLTLMDTPALTNHYSNNSGYRGATLLDVGLERELKKISNDIHVYVGLNAAYMNNGTVDGVVFPYINLASNFDTLGFSYDVDSIMLMAKTKLTKDNIISAWTGYLSASLGAAVNRLSSYQESTPAGSTAAPMLSPFASKNQTSLAFSAGFGVSKKVGQYSEVGLGYYYLDTGMASLNTTPVQQTTQTINNIKLKTHFLSFTVMM